MDFALWILLVVVVVLVAAVMVVYRRRNSGGISRPDETRTRAEKDGWTGAGG